MSFYIFIVVEQNLNQMTWDRPANTPPPALSLLYLDPVHDPKYKEKLQLVHSSRRKTVHPDNTPTPTVPSYLWDADRKPPLDSQGLPAPADDWGAPRPGQWVCEVWLTA